MLDGLKTFDLWEQGLGISPTLPSFYWNVYSYEQRIKEICLRLERMLEYQDVQTDKINECVEQVNKLTEELEALTKEVARINQALLDEISAREAGDQKLETELQQEINDRIKAVNDEATTRQAQVDKLTSDLEAEAKTRQEQVNTLTTNLATETTNREQADTTLQNNIDKVASDLANETTARTEAISGLDTRVTQNTTQITDEVTARTNLGNSLTEAITNETSARETKDKELDQQIADLTADLPSIESDNIFTASAKVPTVNAIQASANQAVSSSNKLATMADVVSGGGTTVNSIAPLTVANAPASFDAGLSFGSNAQSLDEAIAIGRDSDSRYFSVALGVTALCNGNNCVAIGTGARAISENGIAIGNSSSTGANESIVIGDAATAAGEDSVAIGHGSEANDNYTFSVGTSTSTRRIVFVSDPVDEHDAVTKNYVDSREQSIDSPVQITPSTSDDRIYIDLYSQYSTGVYEATFYGNIPAGTVGDAYGFNIKDGETIIGTVAGFRGTTEQTGVPLIGSVMLAGGKQYTIAQTGITTITLRKIH